MRLSPEVAPAFEKGQKTFVRLVAYRRKSDITHIRLHHALYILVRRVHLRFQCYEHWLKRRLALAAAGVKRVGWGRRAFAPGSVDTVCGGDDALERWT
jgi:hypothetical protein